MGLQLFFFSYHDRKNFLHIFEKMILLSKVYSIHPKEYDNTLYAIIYNREYKS